MMNNTGLHNNVMDVLRFSNGADRFTCVKVYDPDGGYWDFETNEWVKYDDMERN